MKKFILHLVMLAMAGHAFCQQTLPPSPNENFLQVEQIRKTGITTEAQINALPVGRDKAVTYTYYDGLGRVLQANQVKASPGAKDIIQPGVVYDSYGRIDKSYLPYTTTTNNGAIRANTAQEQAAFYATPYDGVADDARPFSLVSYATTVPESYGPGQAWYQNGKKTTQKISTNYGSSMSVRLWELDATTGLPVSTQDHSWNTLTLAESADEENRSVRIFSDFTGKTILKQVQEGITWHNTYYVYDDYENLKFIIPPIAATTYAPTQAYADLWYYQFEYDEDNRTIGSKVPGAGWLYTIYDPWNRPALTQDANQRAKPTAEWSFVKYDDWNRPVMSGILSTTASRATLTSSVAQATGRYEVRNTSSVGYTLNLTYPTTITETTLLSITYFDNYNYLSNAGWDTEGYSFAFASEPWFPSANTNPVKGLSTGNKVKVLGEARWLNSVIYYDDKYRPVQTIAEHLKGGVIRTNVNYDEYGQVNNSLLTNTAGNINISEGHTYDDQGRLTISDHWIKENAGFYSGIYLSNLQYNELGHVVSKKLHGENPESDYRLDIDYRYNIRGWLQSINNADLTYNPENNSGYNTDYFGMELRYQDPFPELAATAKFNGNLASVKWSAGALQQGYRYQYDGAERLQHAKYYEKSTNNWAFTDKYSEHNINYDLNGNITTLSRKNNGATTDVLAYGYTGNQLAQVDDTGNKTAGFKDSPTPGLDYEYDPNGNLTADRNLNVTNITYNVLNKPEVVSFSNGHQLITKYDAGGAKLWMEYREGPTQTPAWRYDYVGPFTYKNHVLQTIAHADGRIIKRPDQYEYQYDLKDHLGNNRVTVGAPQSYFHRATASSDQAKEEEEQFMKLSETRATVHPSVNHTKEGGPEVFRLNGGRGKKDGPSILLKVMPGDTLRLKVYAKYLDLRKYNPTATAATVLTLLATPAAGGKLAEGVLATATGHGGGLATAAAIAGVTPPGKSTPKAYMQYVLYDKNMKRLGQEATLVSMAAAITEESVHGPHEELQLEVVARQEGFVMGQLAHEGEENVDVYFDDFSAALSTGPVVRINDYYPYGLTYAEEPEGDELLDRYLYQGKEKVLPQADWQDFHARLYSPALGRFLGTDPQGQFASPYNGMGNNPAVMVDPDGEWAHLVIGAVLGGTMNWMANGAEFSWKGLGHFGIGAAAGALGAGIGAGVNAAIAGGGFGAGFMGTAGVSATGFVAGAATGASGGFTSGFMTGFGNAGLNGQNFGDMTMAGLRDGGIGALSGGVVGGVSGGIHAAKNGRDFWTGDFKQYKITEALYASNLKSGLQQTDLDVYTVSNTDNKDVYYMTEDGVTGLKNKIKPGWYINEKVDGIATSRYKDMVFKMPNNSVVKVYQGGDVKFVNRPWFGLETVTPNNFPGLPYGWKGPSYFQFLDTMIGGNRMGDWQNLFNLGRSIR